jgi:hypothetical protein
MKTNRSKKLNKQIDTICDFDNGLSLLTNDGSDTTVGTGTDPTNTTIITITTVNTGIAAKC